MNLNQRSSLFLAALLGASPACAAEPGPARAATEVLELNTGDHRNWIQLATAMPDVWYGSAEARAIAETVLKYQTKNGGWAKNTGYQDESKIKQDEWARIQQTGIGATFDNDSTLTEMKFLAKVYGQAKDGRYRAAFIRGVEYILAAQYPNGGWPQYSPARPNKSAYSAYVTFNDDVMVNVMRLLADLFNNAAPHAGIGLDDALKRRAKEAFDRGLACILKTQIVVAGQPTVWCAQHHHETLKPAGARTYELPSFSGSESAGVALLLMEIPNPSRAVIDAVQGAVKWFETHRLTGIRLKTFVNADGQEDRMVVEDPAAPPVWARFYDLETGRPFFSDRDGVKKNTFAELGHNRRNGYNWYVDAPAKVLRRYPAWAAK